MKSVSLEILGVCVKGCVMRAKKPHVKIADTLMGRQRVRLSLVAFLLAAAPATAFYKEMYTRVYKDWVALNARSTTRHIMRPSTAEGRSQCLLLKQEIREQVSSGVFVVDAFAAAAPLNSLDLESSDNGGLIGRRPTDTRSDQCVLRP